MKAIASLLALVVSGPVFAAPSEVQPSWQDGYKYMSFSNSRAKNLLDTVNFSCRELFGEQALGEPMKGRVLYLSDFLAQQAANLREKFGTGFLSIEEESGSLYVEMVIPEKKTSWNHLRVTSDGRVFGEGINRDMLMGSCAGWTRRNSGKPAPLYRMR